MGPDGSWDEPEFDRAARQFLALVTYDMQRLEEVELMKALTANVRFFLRGYVAADADS